MLYIYIIIRIIKRPLNFEERRQVGRKVKSWGHRAGPAGLHSWALGSKLTQPFLLRTEFSVEAKQVLSLLFRVLSSLLECHHLFDAFNIVFVYYMAFDSNKVKIFLNAFSIETSVKQMNCKVYLYKDDFYILERSPE